MKPALVLLSDRDTDAPGLSGICTVSKADTWDNGAWALGVAAAHRGAIWCDRPYWNGKPSPEWLADRGRKAVEAGAATVQAGNELDLPEEGWQGGLAAYERFWARLHELAPAVAWLWQPPSGGAKLSVWVPGWPGVNHACHVYGSYAEMRDRALWYLENTTGDIWITECNPGAGQTFDLKKWATNDLAWFLDWCQKKPRIKLVAYFAWRWDLSPRLPSSVDAADTAVATVLQAWDAATEEPMPTNEVGSEIEVGEGFRKALVLLDAFEESEIHHLTRAGHQVSLAIGRQGYATWSPHSNQTVVVRWDGQVWSDGGNRGDGDMRRLA